MESKTDERYYEESFRNALGAALAAIPVVKAEKVKEVVGDDIEVRLRETIRDIPLESLITIMREAFPQIEGHHHLLLGVLTILQTLGVLELESQMGEVRIRAKSETASSLVQNLARCISATPQRKSPIERNSSIKPFSSVVTAQTREGILDPHLLLANLFAFDSKRANDEPIQELRIISVLIKGKRTQPSSDETEYVYLHVYKPEWGKYALIGSRRGENRTDYDTARVALDEDLKTLATEFELRPSGVTDVFRVTPEITRGLNTRHSFNLCIVKALHDELRFRDDLKYAWFTYREIRRGRSRHGDEIMTRAELLERIDSSVGLDSIPVVVEDVGALQPQSLQSQVGIIKKAYGSALVETSKLILRIWRGVWSHRWWFLSIPALVGLFLILRPILNKDLTAIGNIESVIGIVMFLIFIVGLIRDALRRARNSS